VLKTHRPSGNAISLKKSRLPYQGFEPFDLKLYQSGTAALSAAIVASIQLSQSKPLPSEVVLPAYACPDLISAIIHAGAQPVLVDLDHESPHLSNSDLLAKITTNTVAIITVNFLGLAPDLDQLRQICNEKGIYLILDSAQWFPKSEDLTGWAGDFNILSFGRGKPVSLLSGGAILTTRQECLDALPSTKNETTGTVTSAMHNLKTRVYNLAIQPLFYGLVTRLPGLHIGETTYKPLDEIRGLDTFHQRLIEDNVRVYTQRSSLIGEIRSKLSSISSVDLIDIVPDQVVRDSVALLRYPILIKSKAERDRYLELTRNLGVSSLYQRPLNQIPGLENHLDQQALYPQASKFADSLVTIPTHAQADEKLIDKIVTGLESVLSGNPQVSRYRPIE